MLLFDRRYELRVDNILLSKHRISYDIEKTAKPDPNVAQIAVYNLREDQRKQLTSAKTPVTRLSVGYREGMSQVFYGTLIHVEHERDEGGNIITHLTTGDGIEEYRKKRVSATFGPRAKVDTVMRAIVKALGLKEGNIQKAVQILQRNRQLDLYIGGTVITGSAAGELTQLCRSAGIEWSIQDGIVQFLEINQTLDKFAVVLNPTSGLLGSPTLSNKGVLTAECLAVPDLVPGRQLQIKSRWVVGTFRLEKVNYRGDTHGREWGAKIEASQLQTSAARATAKNRRAA